MVSGSRACLTSILSDDPHRPSQHFDGALAQQHAPARQVQYHARTKPAGGGRLEPIVYPIWLNAHPFTTVDELLEVPGIGQRRFEQLKDLVTVT